MLNYSTLNYQINSYLSYTEAKVLELVPGLVKSGLLVLVSLPQLVSTMHNIYKIRGSNPDHHEKKSGLLSCYSVFNNNC